MVSAERHGCERPTNVLPDLIGQISMAEAIGSVTADGAYDTRRRHGPKRGFEVSKYLGRSLWRRLPGYHRRSRIETKIHYLKLPGQRLKVRDFDRQVAELQVRIAVLNHYTALGIPITRSAG